LSYKKIEKKKTKISKRCVRMMEFDKKFGGATKGGCGAWIQPMHLLYTPSIAKDPLSKSHPPGSPIYLEANLFVGGVDKLQDPTFSILNYSPTLTPMVNPAMWHLYLPTIITSSLFLCDDMKQKRR
jgi:hypothetical protein